MKQTTETNKDMMKYNLVRIHNALFRQREVASIIKSTKQRIHIICNIMELKIP